MHFPDVTLKRKLTLIAVLAGTLVVLLGVAGFVAYDTVSYRSRMTADLGSQAAVVAAQAGPSLAFRSKTEAAALLASLEARPEISQAAFYGKDGQLFASYQRDTSQTLPGTVSSIVAGGDARTIAAVRDVADRGQVLGSVYVAANIGGWRGRLAPSATPLALSLSVIALAALLVVIRLHRMVAAPIAELEQSMKQITSEKSFTGRLKRSQNDELGAVADGVNALLFEIQRRGISLQRANDLLNAQTRQLEGATDDRQRVEGDLQALSTSLERRVTERVSAAEQRARELEGSKNVLARQTRIVRSILDSMSDAVIVADDAGRLIVVNPAAERLLKVSGTEMLTDDWVERHGFYKPDMVTPYPDREFPLMQAVNGKAVESAQVFVLGDRGDSQGLWMHVDAVPLRDEDGVVHNGLAIFRNVTTSKRAEDALRKAKEAAESANRSKSQFLANMSHELRTPLNAVIGYSEMLQELARDTGQEDTIPDLQKIHAAGRHLQSLIDDILDLSKIEAGKMELLLDTFDVSQMVHEVTTTLQTLVEKNGNTLEVNCASEVGYMHADMTKVRQVLFNFLSNAGKFTENGSVRLEVSRVNVHGRDHVRFAVRDTGIGMTDEQMSRLFQDFTQVDASTTRKYGGTGLGLAISRRYCEMMGGSIDVDSTPGRGSIFRFELPAKVEVPREVPQAVVAMPAGDVDRAPAGAENLVLVVDDDPIARDMMTRLLAKEGFEVVSAANGTEALQLARERRPAVITLDVIMPDMDGWAVLSALKGSRDVSDIPVVMVTMTDDRHTGYMLGAADYLTKPIDSGRLSALVNRHVSPGATVVVADDDPAARKMTGRYLQKAGWKVIEAENGRVALDRVTEHRPDLVIVDLMMPEMDGFALIDALRADEAGQSIPIVVVTAKDITEEERRRLNGSVGKVLQKAAHRREDLLTAVRTQVRACVQLKTVA